MTQREGQKQPWDRSKECKDMTHYKYFRCLISTHHSAYLLPGSERLQLKALADLPAVMQSSLWTPSLNTQTRIHFHTHILAEPGTDTQALQFCNNGPAHRCVCLFGSNHRNRSSSAQPKGQTEREAIRQT